MLSKWNQLLALKKNLSMKNIFLLFSAIIIFSSTSFAQTVEDAIRYSNLSVGGTARTVGVGGAFGALGADFAGISINPAGLGMYRSSELVMTPTFKITNTEATLAGASKQKENKNNFNFNNVGVVFQNEGRASGKWISNAVAIGYNRVANFNREVYYEGETSGSFTDRFLEQASSLGPDQLSEFESYLAFQTGALYRTDPDDNSTWTTDYLQGGGNQSIFKKQSITQKGAMNEMVLALGANYNHKLMVGVTIGVPFISFEETKIYDEEDTENEIDFFNEMRYEETLKTSGVGINLKLGLVYRISQMFRLGLAVHSPTGMSLNDTYSSSMRYDFTTPDLNGAIEEDSPDGSFDYGLATPWKAIVSGAAIIGRSGFISADVEYMDYDFANFNFTGDTDTDDLREFEQELNTDIDDQLTSAINLRIGGEYAIKNYRIRAGYSNAGSYLDQSDIEKVQAITAGIGIRQEYFYADLAFKKSFTESNYVPYRLINPEDGQQVYNLTNNSRIMVTLGFKF